MSTARARRQPDVRRARRERDHKPNATPTGTTACAPLIRGAQEGFVAGVAVHLVAVREAKFEQRAGEQ